MQAAQQSALIDKNLEAQLKNCSNLPSLPAVAIKIIEASKDPDIGLNEVASLISSDPAIAAKLLKMANSPLYSRRRTVSNLREALTLLGFNASLSVALSFSLFHELKSDSRLSYNHDIYWKRSILSAEIARMLGARLCLSHLEDLFLSGLLQDIGILVLDSLPAAIIAEPDELPHSHDQHVQLEQQQLGTDHSHIGAWLLKSWNFPQQMVNAVLYSHTLINKEVGDNLTDNKFHTCLSFSGSLADLWLDENPNELLQSTLEAAEILLGLDKDAFHDLITAINNQLETISNLFEINLLDEIQRGRLLDEARELTMERSVQFIKQAEEAKRKLQSVTEQVIDIKRSNELDHLTGVYNRKYIDQLLATEYESANQNKWPLSLAFIDVDNFKGINDTHGHLVGDNVLISIAQFFSQNLRKTDVLARYGGDEFILTLPGATSEIAESMLNRLLKLYSEQLKVRIDGQLVAPTVSIGIASHIDKNDFATLKDFVRAADKALYKAKAAGRNCLAVYHD